MGEWSIEEQMSDPEHKEPFKYYTKEADPFYSTDRWRHLRTAALNRSGYMCKYCARVGIRKPADTVHHIYPRKTYPQYQWCLWNLYPVCRACHNKLEDRTNGELTDEGLALLRRLERRRAVGLE